MAKFDWASLRDAILTSFHEAPTAAEREKNLADYQHVLGEVASVMELRGIEQKQIDELRAVTRKEYRLMLVNECRRVQPTTFSNAIDPLTLSALTTREVRAGRMQPTDDFHQHALLTSEGALTFGHQHAPRHEHPLAPESVSGLRSVREKKSKGNQTWHLASLPYAPGG
jgi:hypothetical protein